MPAPRPPSSLPAHASDALMYLGIALMFGSLGPMIALLHVPPGGWVYALFMLLISGLLATAWAFMFQRRGWWFLLLIPLILFPIFGIPPLMAQIFHWPIFRIGYNQPDLTRRIILVVMAMSCISVGFTIIVRYLIRVERQGARAKAELALAAQIHTSLVPPITLSWNSLHIHGTSEPSGEMGGDLIDVVATDDRLDLFLADVSGHGVRAGVVMGMLKATVRTALRLDGHISDHMVTLNAVLADLIESSMFATAVWVRFERALADPSSTAPPAPIRAQVIVAGHPPVFHYRAATRQWHDIGGESMPLGILPAQPFPFQAIDLVPGDALALYTDGLTEAADPAARQLGIAGLRDVIAGLASADLPASRAAILNAVRAGRSSEDDQTLVLVALS